MVRGRDARCNQGRIENNRVTVWQDIRFHYDSHGRLIRKEAGKRSTTHLTWNAEHQLIHSHTQRQGATRQSVRYHYDALGRRIAKTDRFGTTWFVWDGMKMMQEQRGQHCITTIYEDPASYAPLARVEHDACETDIPAERVFYFHTDVNGAPEELTSSYGHVIWRARYRTWGNTVLEEWDREYAELDGNPERPSEEHKRQQNLRFQGQYFDSETGLHYNTFRYYDPDIGRFISQDPIGLAGGMNLYQYAPNPTAWIDPWGWTTCALSAADKKKMGPSPAGMKNPHRHHVVREMAPKNWSKKARGLIYRAQNIIRKHGLNENTSLENFTWAQNGAGAHSQKAAKHVTERLVAADKAGGKQGVLDELTLLRRDLTDGNFY